jgi:D-beta-D-heptose 7-phosphate kinase/D-beta-D-heptose 1-phosphate adenosyltransferase
VRDTVIGTIALALSGDATLLEAAHLANHAAGVAVGKFGPAPVERQELLDTIASGGSAGAP